MNSYDGCLASDNTWIRVICDVPMCRLGVGGNRACAEFTSMHRIQFGIKNPAMLRVHDAATGMATTDCRFKARTPCATQNDSDLGWRTLLKLLSC